MKEDTARDRKG